MSESNLDPIPSSFYPEREASLSVMCDTRAIRYRSTCPYLCPAFEFLYEGEGRSLSVVCDIRTEKSNVYSPTSTRVPASEFLYEEEGRPLFGDA